MPQSAAALSVRPNDRAARTGRRGHCEGRRLWQVDRGLLEGPDGAVLARPAVANVCVLERLAHDGRSGGEAHVEQPPGDHGTSERAAEWGQRGASRNAVSGTDLNLRPGR